MSKHIELTVKYLETEFPGGEVLESYNTDREAHSFKVDDNGSVYRLRISFEFLSDHAPDVLEQHLKGKDIAGLMKNPDYDTVTITNHGDLINQA